MKTLKTLFVLVFLLVSTQITLAVTTGEQAVSAISAVACTMDVKLCSDGVTYVGRTGPSCEFAQCPTLPVICTDLKYDLKVGSTDATTNGEVTKLQAFLHPQYLKVEPTGRLLGLTRAASVEFQKQYGISPAFGNVGPITRAKIKELTCDGASNKLAINSINPSVAKVGQTVVLSGPGLNSGSDFILFDGHRIETDGSKALNRVGFVVPEYITNTINCIKAPCPLGYSKKVVPGVYTIQVVNNLRTTNTVNLTVTDGSVSPGDSIKISSVEPNSAKIGASVIIYGYNLFRPETRILFDGASISGKPVYSKVAGNFNSALEFIVPEYLSPQCNRLKPTDPCPLGMVRQVIPGTYELAVDNKFGRDAVKFEVLGGTFSSKPAIKTLNPSSGPVKTRVAVWGENINSGSEKIYFGGSLVTPIANSATDRKGVIFFDVPEYITPCGYDDAVLCRMMAQQVIPGKYDIVVKNKEGVSNVLVFTVTSSGTTVAPKINSLTPSAGLVGTEVIIKGEGINIGEDKIYFKGGLVSQSLSASADVVNTLRFKVPSYITSCGVGSVGACDITAQQVVPGTYEVVVVNKNGTSNSLSFTVTSSTSQAPIVSSMSRTSAAIGVEVTLTGERLNTGDPKVVLGNGYIIPNAMKVNDSTLSFTIPVSMSRYCAPGLYCTDDMVSVTPGTYDLKVVNSFGTSNVKQLTVVSLTTATPVISSISPSAGGTGIQVTLSGSNFNPASDSVWFGGIKFAPNRSLGSINTLMFNVPTTLFQCEVKSGQECLAMYQPTPLGYYLVKVEDVNGKVSNTVNYQVISNSSTY